MMWGFDDVGLCKGVGFHRAESAGTGRTIRESKAAQPQLLTTMAD